MVMDAPQQTDGDARFRPTDGDARFRPTVATADARFRPTVATADATADARLRPTVATARLASRLPVAWVESRLQIQNRGNETLRPGSANNESLPSGSSEEIEHQTRVCPIPLLLQNLGSSKMTP